MYTLGLILFVVHIVAFVAGGANSVLMPLVGPRLAAATPEGRANLMGIVEGVSRIGKYAMVALLLSGILVLWLKWDWVIPNNWFWAKMAFVALMLVFIGMNEASAKRARAGDTAAAGRSKIFGQLTGVAFLGVIVSAVFAFN